MSSFEFNADLLATLQKEVERVATLEARVGILTSEAARKESKDDEGLNNPTLGAIHEFGSETRRIPARSFLRMPLSLKLPQEMQKIGSDYWVEGLLENGAANVVALLGDEGEAVVQEAFATQGWGAWPKWSQRYLRKRMAKDRKRSKLIGPLLPGSLLIDTAQMRNSVTSVVQERGAW